MFTWIVGRLIIFYMNLHSHIINGTLHPIGIACAIVLYLLQWMWTIEKYRKLFNRRKNKIKKI